MKKHTLHVIGWLGIKRAYLDMPLEEARSRYQMANHLDEAPQIETFTFTDSFGVYEAWSLDD